VPFSSRSFKPVRPCTCFRPWSVTTLRDSKRRGLLTVPCHSLGLAGRNLAV
jgi:hypothetical protein